MDYVYVYFQDEAPVFGCGWQSVLVLTDVNPETAEGEKAKALPREVRLLKWTSCDTTTVPRETFLAMLHSRGARTLEIPDTMVPLILKNAKDYNQYTSTVRDALLALGVAPENLPEQLRRAAASSITSAITQAGPVDATEQPYAGEGSGKFIQRLWMAGVNDPDRLVALVLAAWPGRKTKKSDVFYNYNLLIKAGVEGVPPWPKKD